MHEFIIHKKEDGFLNGKQWKEFWANAENGPYRIQVRSLKKRTLPQNNWFHSVLPDIKDALRNAGFDIIKTDADAKDLVKALFFKKSITNGVETFEVIEGTSETSKINFVEKADEIIRWASEYLGIDIAPPETQLQLKH